MKKKTNLERAIGKFNEHVEIIKTRDTIDTMNPKWQPTNPYIYKSGYNYRCPSCGGEFNHPYIEQSNITDATVIRRCPFCGYKMV